MAPMTPTTLRLSSVQREMLKRLSVKLQIDQANVVRLAISRLFEQEGLTLPKSR